MPLCVTYLPEQTIALDLDFKSRTGRPSGNIMDDNYERVLLVKSQCFVYRLPPRPSTRGYKAADWGLDKPQWTGRMRIVVKSDQLQIKMEDKTSGELFAKAPVEEYPA